MNQQIIKETIKRVIGILTEMDWKAKYSPGRTHLVGYIYVTPPPPLRKISLGINEEVSRGFFVCVYLEIKDNNTGNIVGKLKRLGFKVFPDWAQEYEICYRKELFPDYTLLSNIKDEVIENIISGLRNELESITRTKSNNKANFLSDEISLPAGTAWDKIKVIIESDEEHCEICINNDRHSYKYDNPKLGGVFVHGNTKKPNKLWRCLCNLARKSGNLKWQKNRYTNQPPLSSDSPDTTDYEEKQAFQIERNKNNPQIKKTIKDIQRLRDALQEIFPGVNGNPIPCKNGVYQPIFEIEYRIDIPHR